MHYKKRPRTPEEPTLLPMDYTPGEHVVLIGRGRKCVTNPGNKSFRAMVKAHLEAYQAGRKAKKSSIIKKILREIREGCMDGVGFVKQDAMTGRFYTATTTAAKVTIAQAFRDALNDGYKSSKQHKQFKRDVARGKIDPETEPAHIALMCSTCGEEVDTPHEKDAAMEATMPALAAPKIKPTEMSLKFWGDCIDPLVEFEHTHPGLPGEEKLTKCGCDHFAGHVGHEPQPVKTVDPLEPIPLLEAMQQGLVLGMPTPGKDANHTDCGHCGNSYNNTAFVEDTDDEEDRAIVAWATEFVHCPRCSLVQGRGDFDELPIQDIRKALIG